LIPQTRGFFEFEFLGGFAHVGFEVGDVGVEVGLGGEFEGFGGDGVAGEVGVVGLGDSGEGVVDGASLSPRIRAAGVFWSFAWWRGLLWFSTHSPGARA
jgi:hypothetical protein